MKIELESYLHENARDIDLAYYNFLVHGSCKSEVLKALLTFQNEDGGFGHAIEPDLRLPQSTAIGTTIALQYMSAVDTPSNEEIIVKTINYLLKTYDQEVRGWKIVVPEVDNHPHAPWWGYDGAMKGFGWGNPSAEILGYLIKYQELVDSDIHLDDIKEMAISHIHQLTDADFHEVLNFRRLYDHADSQLKDKLKEPLSRLIKEAASADPDSWKGYGATPLKFVSAPDDSFVDLFDKKLIDKNLEFLLESLIDGTHWEPNWSWAHSYPDEWETAKKEWSGALTVKNFLILKNFGACQ